jgi:hypothetical protein
MVLARCLPSAVSRREDLRLASRLHSGTRDVVPSGMIAIVPSIQAIK